MLKYLFTQNIDGLDLRCGIDEEKVIDDKEKRPIVVLDDVMSELDQTHKQNQGKMRLWGVFHCGRAKKVL